MVFCIPAITVPPRSTHHEGMMAMNLTRHIDNGEALIPAQGYWEPRREEPSEKGSNDRHGASWDTPFQPQIGEKLANSTAKK